MVRAHLPAEGAVTVYDLLNRIAEATAGSDDRPIAARRADALVDICTQLLTYGSVNVGNLHHPRTTEFNTSSGSSQTGAAPTGPAAEPTDPTAGPADTTRTDTEPTAPVTPAPAVAVTPVSATRPTAQLSKVKEHHGRGAHFNLTMSLASFNQFNQDPAELTGHGLIPAYIAVAMKKSVRSLAVIITDSDGHAAAIGSTTYVPTQLITDQVITAAGTCRFPSCRQPAHLCDLDHRTSFDHIHPEQGGPTDAHHLDPCCRSHHLLKTFTGWQPERDPADGLTMVWTSPTQHRYTDPPEEFALPDHERSQPIDAGFIVDSVAGIDDVAQADAADPDAPHACTCTCGHGNLVEIDGSSAQIHAEQTAILIARRDRQEVDAAELRESQRLNLAASPRWVYHLGMEFPSRAEEADELTDEQINADVEQQIAACGSYENYKASDRAFNKRFQPALYSEQVAAERLRQHPDPDQPPF